MNKFRSPEVYFTGLPLEIASCKTDADGKCALTLKRYGRYALAAYAQRQIGDSIEKYYLLIWMSLDDKRINNILLCNDNLIDSFSPNSVIPIKWLMEPVNGTSYTKQIDINEKDDFTVLAMTSIFGNYEAETGTSTWENISVPKKMERGTFSSKDKIGIGGNRRGVR